jgi:hypothetical protein
MFFYEVRYVQVAGEPDNARATLKGHCSFVWQNSSQKIIAESTFDPPESFPMHRGNIRICSEFAL